MQGLVLVSILLVSTILYLAAFAAMIAKFYKKVEQGQALLINKVTKEPIVTFTGGLVLPIIHKAEIADISLKSVEVSAEGAQPVCSSDGAKLDIRARFDIKVNPSAEDVIRVTQRLSAQTTADEAAISAHFSPRFAQALYQVAKAHTRAELLSDRKALSEALAQEIEGDLCGYVVEKITILSVFKRNTEETSDEADLSSIFDQLNALKERVELLERT